MKKLFLSLFLLSLFMGLPLIAQDDKDKSKKDKEKDKAKERALETMHTPSDIKLIRFCTFRASTRTYTGEWNGGVFKKTVKDDEGNPKTEEEKLSLAPKSKRCYWKREVLHVYGEVKSTLPTGTRLELSLVFGNRNGDPFMWKDAKVTGDAKGGWRSFKVTFTFPKSKTVDTYMYDPSRGRSRVKTLRLPQKVLDGRYWIIARYVKSKQNRYIRAKIDKVQKKLKAKDRGSYMDAQAYAYAPKPFYDPSEEGSVGQFSQSNDQVVEEVRRYYGRIISKALTVSKEMDRNFAAAYKSKFKDEKGKFDREAWKKYIFKKIFKRVEPDSAKGKDTERKLFANSRYGSPTSFRASTWVDYFKNKFVPPLVELINDLYKYEQSQVAPRFKRSHTYMLQLVQAILQKGADYTGQLFLANKVENRDQLLPSLPPCTPPDATGARYLNTLFKRINAEVKVMKYIKIR